MMGITGMTLAAAANPNSPMTATVRKLHQMMGGRSCWNQVKFLVAISPGER